MIKAKVIHKCKYNHTIHVGFYFYKTRTGVLCVDCYKKRRLKHANRLLAESIKRKTNGKKQENKK